MMNKLRFLGIIPARSGSKGVKDKNIRMLCGKPLIAYTIESAHSAAGLDRIIVSTDCQRIAEIAADYGAEVPFLRPVELAQSTTPDGPVMRHAVEWLQVNDDELFTHVVYLRPTIPLRKPGTIERAIEICRADDSVTGVRTTIRVQGVHHPYWMYSVVDDVLCPFIEGIDIARYFQRQLLPPCFRLTGTVDILSVTSLLQGELYGSRIANLEVDECEAVDIDTIHDFDLCEYWLSREGN